jgi:methylglyoxal synthase
MKRMRIALIAHDIKKDDIVAFARRHSRFLCECDLLATATTGNCLSSMLNFTVIRMLSGPLGGDLQIGAQLAEGAVSAVFFLRDPMTSMPHEADITALLRMCDVYNIPCATNLASAELLIQSLKLGGVSCERRYDRRHVVYQRQTDTNQVMEQGI